MFWLKKFAMGAFRGDIKIHPMLERLMPSHAFFFEKYPPFWVMGVKFLELDPLWNKVRVRLPLTTFTRNANGFMFGGSQACLADPIAPLAVLAQLQSLSKISVPSSFLSASSLLSTASSSTTESETESKSESKPSKSLESEQPNRLLVEVP